MFKQVVSLHCAHDVTSLPPEWNLTAIFLAIGCRMFLRTTFVREVEFSSKYRGKTFSISILPTLVAMMID